MIYNTVYFEVSGFCNSKCPWCCTGNRSTNSQQKRYIGPNEFKKAIDKLLDLGLVDSSSIFHLYNWGEPMLNPKLNEILKILCVHNLKYNISTNGSIPFRIENDFLENLDHLRISMPGFSQRSYNRIHGFNFSGIMKNIDFFENYLPANKIEICYHIYKFNLGEIAKAADYFEKKKMNLIAFAAYFNDFDMAKSYIDGSMEHLLREMADNDLLLSHIPDLVKNAPPGYQCPQHGLLSIDEYCNLLTCCVLKKGHPNYSLGSIFDFGSKEDVYKVKRNLPVCSECLDKGIAYWEQNPDIYFPTHYPH